MESEVSLSDSGPGKTLLSDRLSPEEAASFAYGRAILCVHVTEAGEDCFMPFCAIPVSVDEDGNAQAFFSGMALTLSSDPTFPLSTEEDGQSGASRWNANGIVLTGDPIFYAELSFLITEENGEVKLISTRVDSPEMYGECQNCPRALFSQGSAYHSYFAFSDEKGSVEAFEHSGPRLLIRLDEALSVTLRPASELGEICVYYEYWFTDGSVTLRMPKTLT